MEEEPEIFLRDSFLGVGDGVEHEGDTAGSAEPIMWLTHSSMESLSRWNSSSVKWRVISGSHAVAKKSNPYSNQSNYKFVNHFLNYSSF